MKFNQVEREHVIQAIDKYENSGLPKGFGPSSTYDLIYNEKHYPPKAIMAYANNFATGSDILNNFRGGDETDCFIRFKKLEFEITKKDDIYILLKNFIEQAQTENLKTKHFPKSYDGLKTQVSFGQGNAAKIPWISFLDKFSTTSDGIYPVYLYYKEQDLLILAYGKSETNEPTNTWNIEDKTSIKEYFLSKFKTKPSRYGSSYVFKTYDPFNLPSSNEINEDLNQIISQYRNTSITIKRNPKTISTQKEFDFKELTKAINESGLIFSDQLIKRFIASLWTKPFVICSGLSGSGKTKLAQAFAMWICQDKSQYQIVPVGADWTNREPLLGYPNALNNSDYVIPENGVLQLILKAKQNENLPFFLILDEMNLSHVERYFADFLSTMESGESIPLHKISSDKLEVPQTLSLPKNLFIIGTVNIDETTYMFSPKVLDRANTIEFRVTEDNLKDYIESDTPLDLSKLEHEGATMAEDFTKIAKASIETNLSTYKDKLVEFFAELKKSGAEFGYRTTSEIGQLISHLNTLGEDGNALLDVAIMQKLLPKLHGSRTKLSKTLMTLGGFCLEKNKENIKTEYFDKYVNNTLDKAIKEDENIKYKLSFEKICRMYKSAIENGFASYAEA